MYHEKYSKVPPRKHDLMVLAEATGIGPELDDSKKDLFVRLSQYYIESRYAEDRKEMEKSCTRSVTKAMLEQTGDVFEWLKRELK